MVCLRWYGGEPIPVLLKYSISAVSLFLLQPSLGLEQHKEQHIGPAVEEASHYLPAGFQLMR